MLGAKDGLLANVGLVGVLRIAIRRDLVDRAVVLLDVVDDAAALVRRNVGINRCSPRFPKGTDYLLALPFWFRLLALRAVVISRPTFQ